METMSQISVAIDKGMSYQEFREMTDNLLAEGKTTGDNHSEAMIHYTKMNVQRMKRNDKTVKLRESLVEKLQNLPEKWYWLMFVESWCGDVAQNLPAIAKMAEATDKVELKLILRDENLELMDQYLTNGGRSIPKMVCVRASDLKELGTWGPRPAEVQQLVMQMKNEDIDFKEKAERLHGWYAKDKNQKIQDEFEQFIDKWKTK
jgi:hypothetical protein